jgi:hypothetical protein
MPPMLSFTATQAAEQITRDNVSWSTLGTPAEITYGFRKTAPPESYGKEWKSFSQVNQAQKDAVAATLAEWQSVANIKFTPVDPEGFTDSAVMLIGNFREVKADKTVDSAAHAVVPATKNKAFTSDEGDFWFNLEADTYTELKPGFYNYSTTLHEIGHAIGLYHPGDYNAGEGTPTYETSAYYIEDTLQYAIMSYWEALKTGADFTIGDRTYESLTPLRDDIAAIQRLYGANMNTRTGDTIYGFNSTADNKAFSIPAGEQVIFSIWDAGGINTLDLSGYDTNQLLDLREGGFSNAGALTKNISIALGTTIHNGVGGDGADTIIGNDANNVLRGNAGDDTIFGGGGHNEVVLAGPQKNYAITITKGPAPFTIQDRFGGDGTDKVSNIQALQFADDPLEPLAATDFVKIRALFEGDINDIVRLYIIEDNRAPDALGLIYWAGRLFDGMTQDQMAQEFFKQDETQAQYPSGMSNSDFVKAAYKNLFEREADDKGLNFWVSELDAGKASRASFLIKLNEGAQESDRDVLANKEKVAKHFAMTQGLTNAEWAKTVIADVNATEASVTAANQQTAAFAATAATAETAELVVKVLGIVA